MDTVRSDDVQCTMSIELPCLSTCLSEHVHKLMLDDTWSKERDVNVITGDGCLDVEYIFNKLPVASDSCASGDDSSDTFRACVAAMAPMLHLVEDLALTWTHKEVVTKYSHLLTWTGHAELLLSTWSRMYDGNDVEDLALLLLSTSLLEHCLGDVYLMKGTAPCPSMLKDLLRTEELRDILGHQLISILRVLIGPPTSLNVRNVVWHGFPYPGELPRRCIWFILLLFPSVGHILHQKDIAIIPHRDTVTFPDIKPVSDWSLWVSDTTWLSVVSRTQFVHWPCQLFWEQVTLYYRNKQYGLCAALVLYYLEQGLRRVFAAVNNCPHRVLTAESTTLYTTLDEILSPYLPDGGANKLRFCIHESVLEVLFDLLVYQDGPRVRDRLSHGEADWTTFPAGIADNLITVALVMSAMFVPRQFHVELGIISQLKTDLQMYSVQFHPIAVVKSKVKELLSIHIDDDIHLLPDLSERPRGSPYPVTTACKQLEEQLGLLCAWVTQCWDISKETRTLPDSVQYNHLNQLLDWLRAVLEEKIPTLYREAVIKEQDSTAEKEGETVTLLRHIMTECINFISNARQFAVLRQRQLADKLLRSRQRKNFIAFLECVPQYVTVGCMCGLMVTWQLYHLQEISRSPTAVDGMDQNRFWKNVLQYTENLRTYSNPENNKWLEGTRLCKQLGDLMLSQFQTAMPSLNS